MAKVVEKTTAVEESTFHAYTGNEIPWYVRSIWIIFWCYAIAYVVTLAPAGPPVRAAGPAMSIPARRPVCDYCQLPLPRAGGAGRAPQGSRPRGPSGDLIVAWDAGWRRRSSRRETRRVRCGDARPPGPVDLLHDERHGVHHGALDDRCLRTRTRDRARCRSRSPDSSATWCCFFAAGPLLSGLSRCSSTPGPTCAAASFRPTGCWPRASCTSFAVSFLSVFRGEGPIYFEVGCVILVMTTLGRWLEATGRLQAGTALDASRGSARTRSGGSRTGTSSSSRASMPRSTI